MANLVAPFRLPTLGYRPDVWYWLLVANTTIYRPSNASYRRIYEVGGPVEDAVFFRQNAAEVGPFLPDWDMITYPEDVLICVQGTMNGSQRNAQLVGVVQEGWDEGPGRVSPFYLSVARALLAQMETRLEAKLPRRVTLLGHSFGAPVTSLIGTLIHHRRPGNVARVVNFGGPRAGNSAYAEDVPVPLVNVFATGDPIPLIPAASTNLIFNFTPLPFAGPIFASQWAHGGIRYTIQEKGEVLGDWAVNQYPSLARSFVPDLRPSGSDLSSFGSHSTYDYAIRIRQNLPIDLGEISPRIGWVDFPQVDAVLRQIASDEGTPFRVRGVMSEEERRERLARWLETFGRG